LHGFSICCLNPVHIFRPQSVLSILMLPSHLYLDLQEFSSVIS
jgi:hypothetical protein